MLSRLLTRREQFILGFLGVAIFSGAVALLWTKREASTPEPLVVESAAPPTILAPKAEPAIIPSQESQARQIAVSIVGAVGRPGVYRLDEDSRIEDLISEAGGLRDGDTSDINLAARLIDGTTLTIPPFVDESGGNPGQALPAVNPSAYTISGQGLAISAPSSSAASGGSTLVSVNRATQAELETLPGIGPKLAQQIIQHREAQPFGDIAEVMDVPGIGPQRFDAIRELITID